MFYEKVNDFRMNECVECGLIWTDDLTSAKTISFYDENYFHNNSKIGYQDYLAAEENHRKNSREIIKAAGCVQELSGGRILDIGCAYGFLLDEVRKIKQCESYGVEVSVHAYAFAKELPGLHVYNCELQECGFPPGYFDAVFLIGTIEHLAAPIQIVSMAAELLKPGGIMVITTLDTAGLIPLYSLKPPEHVFYFNRRNLQLVLEKFALKTVSCNNYFVNYQLHDLFHRVGEFSSLSLFGRIAALLKQIAPRLSVKIPTNEMILIARKESIR